MEEEKIHTLLEEIREIQRELSQVGVTLESCMEAVEEVEGDLAKLLEE